MMPLSDPILDLRDLRRMLADFPLALRVIADVMKRGHATHDRNWRDLPAGFHLARARQHLDLLASGDVSEAHLAHAACRLLMELERHARVGGGSPLGYF